MSQGTFKDIWLLRESGTPPDSRWYFDGKPSTFFVHDGKLYTLEAYERGEYGHTPRKTSNPGG